MMFQRLKKANGYKLTGESCAKRTIVNHFEVNKDKFTAVRPHKLDGALQDQRELENEHRKQPE
jgi:hypothetical protein